MSAYDMSTSQNRLLDSCDIHSLLLIQVQKINITFGFRQEKLFLFLIYADILILQEVDLQCIRYTQASSSTLATGNPLNR